MLCCLKWLRSRFILCWHYSCCSQLSQAVGGTLQLLYLIWSHSPQLHYAMTASESWSIIYLCSTSCQGPHCVCLGVFQHAILISIWRAIWEGAIFAEVLGSFSLCLWQMLSLLAVPVWHIRKWQKSSPLGKNKEEKPAGFLYQATQQEVQFASP